MKKKIEEYPEKAQHLVAEVGRRVAEARNNIGISQDAGVERAKHGDYGTMSQQAWSRVELGEMSSWTSTGGGGWFEAG